MSERLQTAFLCALLLCVGTAAWAFELRSPLSVDVSSLRLLPYEIAGFHGHDDPLDRDVARILEADFNLQRTYSDSAPDPIWLYLGYYGTERGGATPHTPDACYPAAGWTIDESTRRVLAVAAGLSVNEIQVVRGGSRRLVHYWFRSHRSTGILGGLGQGVDRLVGRLLYGRADGGFVRVSTPIEIAGEEYARARLATFVGAADPLLGAHWPNERPQG